MSVVATVTEWELFALPAATVGLLLANILDIDHVGHLLTAELDLVVQAMLLRLPSDLNLNINIRKRLKTYEISDENTSSHEGGSIGDAFGLALTGRNSGHFFLR